MSTYEIERFLVWVSNVFKSLRCARLFILCTVNEGERYNGWRGFYYCPSVVNYEVEALDGWAREEGKIENAIETQTNTIEYVVTAYCGCIKCCGKNDCITATGTRATEGRTIAIDPNVIPYGTTVYIDGVGERIAEDCGGAINGNRIDLYFESHTEALNFGVRTMEVTVLN